MNALRGVLAVLSGPIVYGLVCLPGNLVLMMLFPESFNEDGSTEVVGLLLTLLLLSVVYAACAGYVGGWIAGRKAFAHSVGVAVLLLVAGISVQIQYWDVMPVWYHLSFFVAIIVGALLGGYLRERRVTPRQLQQP